VSQDVGNDLSLDRTLTRYPIAESSSLVSAGLLKMSLYRPTKAVQDHFYEFAINFFSSRWQNNRGAVESAEMVETRPKRHREVATMCEESFLLGQ
jgi:hypothetical protein